MNKLIGYVTLLSLLLTSAVGSACACRRTATDKPIVILYDNDVHCAIKGYVQMAGLRDAIQSADTAYVMAVSVGDYVQGSMVGSLSHGDDMVPILNAVDYTALTVGNHEFDYGAAQLKQIIAGMQSPVLCVNLTDCATQKQLCAPYTIKRCGKHQVAFVGVLTPQTAIAEGYSFYDEEGHQLLDVHPNEVAQLVQQAVNAVRRKGADYVVVLSHLGESTNSYTSRQLIADTYGIDVVLDGHSHSVIKEEWLPNAKGKMVCTTQTGTKFSHVGKLYISSHGVISTSLIPTADVPYRSARVQAVIDSIELKYQTLKARPCGYNESLLDIYDDTGIRDVRRNECPLANFITDCIRRASGAEIVVTNGGGIRENLPQGEISYGNIFDVLPFNNELMLISVPGAHLRAMIEKECATLPEENGMFVHPSGLRYEVLVPASPRVQRIEVEQPDGTWALLEDDKEYLVCTTDYIYGLYLSGDRVIKGAGIGVPRDVLYQYIITVLNRRIPAAVSVPDGRIVVRY